MAGYEYNSWQPLEEGECCVAVSHSVGLSGITFSDYANLPCYPEEISNTVEGIWATQSILGRTGTINAFTGTSDISVNFSFHGYITRDFVYLRAHYGTRKECYFRGAEQ